MEYEAVIGLEVHVQLNTDSKIFCNCSTQFGNEPNSNTCPVCLGLPGSLPVLNKKALDYAIELGLALDCKIQEKIKFDRKQYFYPDLPKAYQISQFDMPVAYEGYIDIEVDGNEKRIGVTRAHLEEDAGKSIHDMCPDGTLVDYNRTGTPLLEIVSEPDISTPDEAYAYLTNLKARVQYLGVSDCNMEEGSLRCDANVSIRPKGQKEFGTKVEIKNLNSFRAVRKSIEYEINRQEDAIEDGEAIVQETRLWDDGKNCTMSMRSKEEAHDYRYFPEPDLVPFSVPEDVIEEIRKSLPEMPEQKKERFISEYSLSEYDAGLLTSEKKMADFFENAVKVGAEAKPAANWIQGDILKYMNDNNASWDSFELDAEKFAGLLKVVKDGKINNKTGKSVLVCMIETGKTADAIIEEKGLAQVSDEGALKEQVEKIVNANEQSVADYKAGKKKAIGFLMGQVMKAMQGKANPQVVSKLLIEAIEAK